jgi:hypothetical protein
MLTDDRIYKMPDGDFEKVLDQASATMQKLRAEFARPHEDLVREDQALMNIAPPESAAQAYMRPFYNQLAKDFEAKNAITPPDDGPEYTVKDLMTNPPPKGARFRITAGVPYSTWHPVGSEVTFLSVTKFGIRVSAGCAITGFEDPAWRFVRLPPEQLSFDF